MERDLHHTPLRRWLEAELRADGAQSRELVADEALFGLFSSVPGPAPSPGFAEQTLMRAGLLPMPVDLARAARLPTALALLSTGLAVAFFLPWAFSLVAALDPSSILMTIVRAFGLATQAVVDLLRLGHFAASVGRIFWLVLTSPQVMGPVCLMAGLAALLSRWLVLLINSDRSSPHAHARF